MDDGIGQPGPNAASSAESPWLGEVVEQAWRKLRGQVPRERIREVAAAAAANYAEARVGTFVPILVERRVRERLQPEIPGATNHDDAVFPAGAAGSAGTEPTP